MTVEPPAVRPLRFSIVTPSFQQAAFLERTLESVAAQGWPDVEHIVVDGGSTDGSAEILERWSPRLAWWVSEPDRGQSHAINKGLQHATGDIVAYINSDDFYLPGAFAVAAAAFERDAAVRWIAGACRYELPDGTLETVWRPTPPVGPRALWVRDTWYVPQTSSFWRRDVIDELGAFREDLHFTMDVEFGLRLALAGVLPHIVDAELAVRWVHEEAKSAEPERWQPEYAQLRADLLAEVGAGDRAAAFAYRARRGLGRRLRRLSR